MYISVGQYASAASVLGAIVLIIRQSSIIECNTISFGWTVV